LSELLDAIAREPVQIEVSAVRILFELLGFLLKTAVSCQLSASSYPGTLQAHDSFYFPKQRQRFGAVPDSSASFRLQ
jgi:hypothetical protein